MVQLAAKVMPATKPRSGHEDQSIAVQSVLLITPVYSQVHQHEAEVVMVEICMLMYLKQP